MKKHMKLWFHLLVQTIIVVQVSLILSYWVGQLFIAGSFHLDRLMFMFTPTVISAFFLATSMLLTISLTFINRINYLVAAMRKVADGDFSVRLEEDKGPAETRQMNRDFNFMAEELSKTETLRNDFVANVSHEFKTPLASIEGYATLLMDPETSPGEAQDYAARILESTRQLTSLTTNILRLSKLESGAIDEKPASFRLDEQIREAFLSMEPQWSKKDLEIDMDLPEVQITGYENLIYQIWINLFSNAVKFSPKGGLIRARMDIREKQVQVTISDSGPGMTEEQMRHIFDKFYQGDTTHRSEGNGLGLALVARILKISGGIIQVESELGKGSAFTVTLPRRLSARGTLPRTTT